MPHENTAGRVVRPVSEARLPEIVFLLEKRGPAARRKVCGRSDWTSWLNLDRAVWLSAVNFAGVFAGFCYVKPRYFKVNSIPK